jgi:hypothetical protein
MHLYRAAQSREAGPIIEKERLMPATEPGRAERLNYLELARAASGQSMYGHRVNLDAIERARQDHLQGTKNSLDRGPKTPRSIRWRTQNR